LIKNFYAKYVTPHTEGHGCAYSDIRWAIRSGNKKAFWYLFDLSGIHQDKEMGWYISKYVLFPIIKLGRCSWLREYVRKYPGEIKAQMENYHDDIMMRALRTLNIHTIELLLRLGLELDACTVDQAQDYIEQWMSEVLRREVDDGELEYMRTKIISIMIYLREKCPRWISWESIQLAMPEHKEIDDIGDMTNSDGEE
jgi:hypothetical protein